MGCFGQGFLEIGQQSSVVRRELQQEACLHRCLQPSCVKGQRISWHAEVVDTLKIRNTLSLEERTRRKFHFIAVMGNEVEIENLKNDNCVLGVLSVFVSQLTMSTNIDHVVPVNYRPSLDFIIGDRKLISFYMKIPSLQD